VLPRTTKGVETRPAFPFRGEIFSMKLYALTLTLTMTVLLGSSGVCWSADFQKGADAFERRDYATALKEWTPLAEQGLSDAQYNLGRLYDEGPGSPLGLSWCRHDDKGLCVPQDNEAAVKWYTLAAEQGHAKARTRLATLVESPYRNGRFFATWDESKFRFGNDSISFTKERYGMTRIAIFNRLPPPSEYPRDHAGEDFSCVDGLPSKGYGYSGWHDVFWDASESRDRQETFSFFNDAAPTIAVMYASAGATGWGSFDLYLFDVSSNRYVTFSDIECRGFPEFIVNTSGVYIAKEYTVPLYGPFNFAWVYLTGHEVVDESGEFNFIQTAKIYYERYSAYLYYQTWKLLPFPLSTFWIEQVRDWSDVYLSWRRWVTIGAGKYKARLSGV